MAAGEKAGRCLRRVCRLAPDYGQCPKRDGPAEKTDSAPGGYVNAERCLKKCYLYGRNPMRLYTTLHKPRFGFAPDGMRRCKPGQQTRRVRREPKKYRRKPMDISKYIIGLKNTAVSPFDWFRFPDGCLGRGRARRARRGTRTETSKAWSSIKYKPERDISEKIW